MTGALLSRAASRAATTVEEEVTFCDVCVSCDGLRCFLTVETYNGGNGELVLASVLEESEDIVADDDTSLAAKDFLDTHCCCL